MPGTPEPVSPAPISTDAVQAEVPGKPIPLLEPRVMYDGGEPYACFDEEGFAQLDARDELHIEFTDMARRNAEVIGLCSELLSIASSEVSMQYAQGKAFRATLARERRQRLYERIGWAALITLIATN